MFPTETKMLIVNIPLSSLTTIFKIAYEPRYHTRFFRRKNYQYITIQWQSRTNAFYQLNFFLDTRGFFLRNSYSFLTRNILKVFQQRLTHANDGMTTIDTHVVSLGECVVFHEWTTTRKISDWSMLWEFEEFEQRGSILHELAPIFGWTKWPGLTKQTSDKPTAITTIGIRGSARNWLLGFLFFFLYRKVTKCFVNSSVDICFTVIG